MQTVWPPEPGGRFGIFLFVFGFVWVFLLLDTATTCLYLGMQKNACLQLGNFISDWAQVEHSLKKM